MPDPHLLDDLSALWRSPHRLRIVTPTIRVLVQSFSADEQRARRRGDLLVAMAYRRLWVYAGRLLQAAEDLPS